jgi:hypothetical protein
VLPGRASCSGYYIYVSLSRTHAHSRVSLPPPFPPPALPEHSADVPGLYTYTDTVRFLESSAYTDGTDSPAEGIRSAEAEEGAAAAAAAAESARREAESGLALHAQSHSPDTAAAQALLHACFTHASRMLYPQFTMPH